MENQLKCPITLEAMRDPVKAADGHTYERSAIEQHFLLNGAKSPLTNLVLPHTRLTSDITLRTLIDEWPQREHERIMSAAASAVIDGSQLARWLQERCGFGSAEAEMAGGQWDEARPLNERHGADVGNKRDLPAVEDPQQQKKPRSA